MDFTDFIIGGAASVGATFFTNPLEVIKTRIQLQGELAAKGTYVEPYKGVLNAFITVAKKDGLAALQKGLVPALYFQFILNAFRLGFYNTAIENKWIHNEAGDISFVKGIFWGAFGGITGSLIANPFFLIKTRLQSKAVESIAVGFQHKHTGMFNAMSDIYSREGIRGLWRGGFATFPRASLASGTQIATFGTCKDFLKSYGIIHPTANSFLAAAIAGTMMSFAMTPPDVIITRLYNQGVDERGKGMYYNGVIDCFLKILRTEGILGLYKGFWPNYIRIAPHSTLVLLFFDEMIKIRNKYRQKESDH